MLSFVFAFLINSAFQCLCDACETPAKRKLMKRGYLEREGLFASFIKDELIRKFDNKIGSFGKGGTSETICEGKRKILIRKSAAIKGGDGGSCGRKITNERDEK